MDVFKGIIIAFSMFSRIPMPRAQWDNRGMKYMLVAFPLVGIFLGAAIYFWYLLCESLGIGMILRAVGFVLLPLAITGGIHLDGFADTVDALSSHQSRERKLEIMSDPHCGAFAVMGIVSYISLFIALYAELRISSGIIIIIAMIPVLSRALSALALLSFPCAKEMGLAKTFAEGSSKKHSLIILYLESIIVAFVMLFYGKIVGLFAIISAIVTLAIYYRMSKKEFGGVTGDLAGWFLSVVELVMVFTILIMQYII